LTPRFTDLTWFFKGAKARRASMAAEKFDAIATILAHGILRV